MFIDRAAAMDASRKAAALGIGPRVHDDLAAHGIEISDFIEGRRSCTHADFCDVARCRTVLDVYRRLHGGEPLVLTKTVFDMIDEHVEQVRVLGAWAPPDHGDLDVQYRRARAAPEASGLDLVPCFNDPMAGNFMLDDAGTIMLIDYEYASNNDRCYDLGVWFGKMFFDEPTDLALVEHYFGRADPATVARVTLHKMLADAGTRRPSSPKPRRQPPTLIVPPSHFSSRVMQRSTTQRPRLTGHRAGSNRCATTGPACTAANPGLQRPDGC